MAMAKKLLFILVVTILAVSFRETCLVSANQGPPVGQGHPNPWGQPPAQGDEQYFGSQQVPPGGQQGQGMASQQYGSPGMDPNAGGPYGASPQQAAGGQSMCVLLSV